MLRISFRLTTVDALPNELLSRIFSFATHSGDRAHALSTPVVLSHVSRRWRVCAIATTALWTTLVLTFPTSPTQLAHAAAALFRSHKRTLDILLDFRDPDWEWNAAHPFRWQDMQPVMHALLPHVARWRRITLLTDTWEPMFAFLWYTHRFPAPQLEELALARCNVHAGAVPFQPAALRGPLPLFADSAPALRSVALAGVHAAWPRAGLRGLTTLALAHLAPDVAPSRAELHAILSACPDLTTFTVIGWSPPPDACAHVPVPLPHLRRLTLGSSSPAHIRSLFTLFECPAVDTLAIEGAMLPDGSPALCATNAVLQYLASPDSRLSHARIRTLELRWVHAGVATCAALFAALSAVRCVIVHGGASSVLQALAPVPLSQVVPCPLLEVLRVRRVCPDTFSTVLAARKSSGAASVKCLCVGGDDGLYLS